MNNRILPEVFLYRTGMRPGRAAQDISGGMENRRSREMIKNFGKTSDGRWAGLYILRNARGAQLWLTDYGAAIVRLMVPDKDGELRDVVLGYDDAAGYEKGEASFGAVIGRFANRIGEARFELNREWYTLTANQGPNTLHGGRDFYNKRLWEAKIPFSSISSHDIASTYALESLNDYGFPSPKTGEKDNMVTFVLESPNEDQGFPGNLHIEVTYTLTEENEVRIDYYAYSDRDTPLNLTNHSYFNLSGHDSGPVFDQVLMIDADAFTPNDDLSLPTGEIRSVANTPFDFRTPKPIGRDMGRPDEQLKVGNGYDHNYVLKNAEKWMSGEAPSAEPVKAASLYSEESGIAMDVYTDLPGMQLYTGNYISGEFGKNFAVYGSNAGVCFETQFWPDAVNKKNFPGGWIAGGKEFRSTTVYAFSVKK